MAHNDSYNEKLGWQKSQPNLQISYNLDYDPSSIWEIPAVSDTARELPFYIQEIGRTIAYDKYYVERAGLESYMFCYITDGAMALHYNGTQTVLSPGDFFWIDCRSKHILSLPRSASKVDCYFIHFNGTGISHYKDYFDGINETGILHLSDANLILPYIQRLLNRFTHQKRSIMTDLEASNLLSNICYCLVDEARRQAKSRIPDSIGRMRDYLAESYTEKISLDSLSAQFFLSKSYLQRQFKRYTGLSPLEFLTQTRISEAKKLLRTTSLPIQTVALQVGFEDPSYFIQVFRHQESMTPLKYKKLWMTEQPVN